MKNFIIGYGETLTSKVTINSGGGDKSHPYTVLESRRRFASDLTNVMTEMIAKPTVECDNDEVVMNFKQHPA